MERENAKQRADAVTLRRPAESRSVLLGASVISGVMVANADGGAIEARDMEDEDQRYRREMAEEAILKTGDFDPEILGLRTDIVTRRAPEIAMDGPYAAAFAEAACWSQKSLETIVNELQSVVSDLQDGCDPKVAARRISGMIGRPRSDA